MLTMASSPTIITDGRPLPYLLSWFFAEEDENVFVNATRHLALQRAEESAIGQRRSMNLANHGRETTFVRDSTEIVTVPVKA